MARFNLPRFRLTRRMQVIGLMILIAIVGIIWYGLSKVGTHRLITSMEIVLKGDEKSFFTSQQEISNLVSGVIGNPVSHSADEINLTLLETTIKRLPFVEKSEVYVSLDGKLKIIIQQRVPVARINNSHGETFFLDSAGIMIPQNEQFTPDVPIANGNIVERMSAGKKVVSAPLKDILEISKKIISDDFLNAQFEQLYVDNYSDIILIPRVGKHSIVVGNAENLDEKFQNLRVFYDKALNTLGWDKYKIVNLKYKGQVVGVKNNTENHTQEK